MDNAQSSGAKENRDVLTRQLDGFDIADDIVLPSSSWAQAKVKIERLSRNNKELHERNTGT